MAILMEKEISIDRTIAVNNDESSALARPIRGKIVELLNKKTLNAEQIRRRHKQLGYKKSLTTIRHHIEILKNSGLIEVTKIEESQGAITKYYGSSTKLLDFALPSDFDENYSKIISKTSLKLEKIVGPILKISRKHEKYNKLITTSILLWKL